MITKIITFGKAKTDIKITFGKVKINTKIAFGKVKMCIFAALKLKI